MIYDISSRITTVLNGRNGKWSRDFYVEDGRTYHIKISAANEPSNILAIRQFAASLPNKIREINSELGDIENPIAITRLEILDISTEDAIEMKKRDDFVELYTYSTFDEDIEDWDSGIHKLIMIEI